MLYYTAKTHIHIYIFLMDITFYFDVHISCKKTRVWIRRKLCKIPKSRDLDENFSWYTTIKKEKRKEATTTTHLSRPQYSEKDKNEIESHHMRWIWLCRLHKKCTFWLVQFCFLFFTSSSHNQGNDCKVKHSFGIDSNKNHSFMIIFSTLGCKLRFCSACAFFWYAVTFFTIRILLMYGNFMQIKMSSWKQLVICT